MGQMKTKTFNRKDRMISNISLYIKKLKGIYQWEQIQTCPLCGAQEFEPYLKQRFGLLMIQLQSCRHCKLIIQNPCLTRGSLDNFYHNEYRLKVKEKIDTKHCENMFERGLRRGAYVCKFLDESGIEYKDSVVFEAGCGYGGILQQFHRHNCQVVGCDVDPVAVQYGLFRGLDLKIGSIDVLADLDLKADIIILSHILEHIVKPNLFLKKVQQSLKPDGILYVEVPGIGNSRVESRRYVHLEHILYFNQETLCKLIEKAGFQPILNNEIVQSTFRNIKGGKI